MIRLCQKRVHKKLRFGVDLERLKVDLGETQGGGDGIFGVEGLLILGRWYRGVGL